MSHARMRALFFCMINFFIHAAVEGPGFHQISMFLFFSSGGLWPPIGVLWIEVEDYPRLISVTPS